MGIYQVTLAGLDTVTNGAADGYQDYGCRARAARLVPGTSYTLTVRTNPNADETVRAWLDYDQDGAFAAAEQVLASTGRRHTATFTVPVSAATGAICLRVAADYVNAPVPTACSTPQYSQTEDYRAVVLAGAPAARPRARFAALDTVSCGAAVTFRDQSLNASTSWRWDFGDGTSSTQQHPQHLYPAPGTYALRLRACNAGGCDSLTKVGYILVRADAPRSAPCQPATAAHCCGFGLTRVQLAGLDQHSADGAAGYQDFSCAQRATLTADRPYALQLTTGPNAHDVRAYLDLNDDGSFAGPAELLYEGLAVQSPSLTLLVPSTAPGIMYGRPLRLRLWTDAAGMPFTDACTAPQRGQVEDYSVMLSPNAAPPVAAFAVTYQQLCGPVRVAFTNQTTAGATSYRWDFGDGTSSTAATPPAHTYAQAGAYTLRLVAVNAFGADSTSHTVAVATDCPTYCIPAGRGSSLGAGLSCTSLQLGTLDNRAPRALGTGYFDFTAQYTELEAGRTYTLRAESDPWSASGNGPWVYVTVWLDRNQDGQFGTAEILARRSDLSPHVLTFRVPDNALPGTTRLRVQIQARQSEFYSESCTPAVFPVSTEDYTVVVVPAPRLPRPGFAVDVPLACSGAVQFRDTSWYAPAQWRWDFGDGSTSAQQHPLHRYTRAGTYSVRLWVRNNYGADSVLRPALVTVPAGVTGPVPAAACRPADGSTIFGLHSITLGGQHYLNAADSTAGYRDETCRSPAVTLPAGAAVPAVFRMGLLPVDYSVYAWLDANDDAAFDATELVYSSNSEYAGADPKTGLLSVPATAIRNRPLRLRVLFVARYDTNPITTVTPPCIRPQDRGQVRDFTAIVTSATASAAPGSTSEWQLYPNPAQRSVTLKLPLTVQVIQLRLYSSLGQEVRRLELPRSGLPTLSLPDLPTGTYTARLVTAAGLLTNAQKLVIMP